MILVALGAAPLAQANDERFASLESVKAFDELMATVGELRQTILLVTHNARDAAWSDEVHFLKDGELHEEARLDDERVTPEGIAASLDRLGI